MSESVSITLQNVSKHYGKTCVLQPFTLTLDAGCRTVLRALGLREDDASPHHRGS